MNKLQKMNMKKIDLPKLPNAKVGDILSARIVEVQENKIIADIQGKLVLLNDLLDLGLTEGDQIALEVRELSGGQLITQPAAEGFEKVLTTEQIKNELSALKIATSDRNVEILRFLKENNIKYSESELKKIVQSVRDINKLITSLTEKPDTIYKLDSKASIRELLVNIITDQPAGKNIDEILKALNLDEKSSIINNEEIIKTDVKLKEQLMEPIKVIRNLMTREESAELNALKTEGFSNDVVDFTKGMVQSLENFDLKSLAFLVKQEFDINLEQLLLSKNFFHENKSVAESLQKIIAHVIPHSIGETETIKAIEGLFTKFFSLEELTTETIKETMNNLAEKYPFLETESEVFEEIKSEIVFLKEVNDFNQLMEDQISYFQFVLADESDELREVEIFSNKNTTKEKNRDSFKIYISLKTNNYKTVRSIIDLYKNRRLSVKIMVEDQVIKNIFDRKILQLERKLEKFDYDVMEVKTSIRKKQKKVELLSFNNHKLDLKV